MGSAARLGGKAVMLAGLIGGTIAPAAADTTADASELAETVAAILDMPGDPAYGQYLAGECTTCHGGSGGSAEVPAIEGLARLDFVTALVEYREGVRENEVMATTAARLGDEEIAALAAHFAAE